MKYLASNQYTTDHIMYTTMCSWKTPFLKAKTLGSVNEINFLGMSEKQ
jgi:hypothetical protein